MSCVAIVAPTVSGNALGRATSLAELASGFGEVAILAPPDGRRWSGAARCGAEIRAVAGRQALRAALASLPEPVSIWVAKPLPRAWALAREIARLAPNAPIVVDVDDDDEGFSTDLARSSPLGRLQVHPLRPLAPWRVARARGRAFAAMDALTYASEAVRSVLGLGAFSPALHVPHPRRAAEPARAMGRAAGRLELGFLGTARPYKGVDVVERLVASDGRLRLHVFASDRRWRRVPVGRLVEHDAGTPLERLYGGLDAVLLPQRPEGAANVQLPAKLLDAMSYGVAVFATPTAAIAEVAGDAIEYVEDWSDTEAVVARIAARPGGETGRRRFEERLSIESQLSGARDFFTELTR